MSDDEQQESLSSLPPGWKKRRLQGACDTCRRKKGDSANMPGNRCSNCIAFNLECTHSEPPKKRGPKSTYVENLEKRVKSLEEVIRKFSPGANLDSLTSKDNAMKNSPSPPSLSSISAGSPIHPPTSSDSPTAAPSSSQDDDDLAHVALAEHLKLLSLDAIDKRFFGESSGFMLLRSAHGVKSEFTGIDSFNARHFKRPKYWGSSPWERLPPIEPTYVFPEHDLLVHLIALYFEKVNAFLPVLHAPTFKRNIAQGLHMRNNQFGATVLLVCAVASRYSEDPRVLAVPGEYLSCGWQWYQQVSVMRQSLFEIPTLYELQMYCLATIHLIGSSCPQAAWTLVSIGIRFAQELGVHRRKPDGYKLTAEAEQMKRAFWVLVSLDRLISCFVGRPSSIRDEDFDVEPPIEVDDEYWENFTQPPDKPSVISCFVWHLKLCEILAFTLRTLYATKKSKILLGLVGDNWEQTTVAELDSALNAWVNSIPDHLRWDPNREDKLFFHQSAFLYIQYYHCQIQTHRPFIQKKSPLSFPSLAICTNASRACIHVVEVHARRGIIGLPHVLNACFTAGVVLLFNIWGSKRAGVKIDPQRELSDVKKMIEIFNACDRWIVAGRFCDILAELAQDLNPSDHISPSNKRARDSDVPLQMIQSKPLASSHQPAPPMIGHLQEKQTLPIKTAPSSYTHAGQLHSNREQRPEASQHNTYYNYNISIPVLSSAASEGVSYAPPQPTGLPGHVETTFDTLFVDSNTVKATYADANSGQTDAGVHNFQAPDAAWAQALDSNAVNMWMSAPVGFNFDDWGNYIERDMFSVGRQSSGSSPGIYPKGQRE